ncbi:MAG TPA: hypothetical protein VH678_18230 [Xanthobacteraceae bacterium]|jgi:hypothetical protein
MIRFFFRFVGLLLLALAFVFAVYDGTRWLADQRPSISTTAETWSNIHQNSLSALQPIVERLIGGWFWQGIFKHYILDQPVWLVLGVIASILILLGRKKKPLIGYARD